MNKARTTWFIINSIITLVSSSVGAKILNFCGLISIITWSMCSGQEGTTAMMSVGLCHSYFTIPGTPKFICRVKFSHRQARDTKFLISMFTYLF